MAEKKVRATKKKKVGKKKAKSRKIKVYAMDGSVSKEIKLPEVFSSAFRPDIISRASVSIWANRRQPYAPKSTAGMRHAVSTWGKGRGVSRVQRLKQGSTAAQSPGNVGGRRAHPPRIVKDMKKRMNRKEMQLARISALAAVSDREKVENRGHRIPDDITLPVIIENDLEEIKTTKDAIGLLESIGLTDDLKRAEDGRTIRAGRGKMRGRRYRTRKSLLIIVSDSCPAQRSFSNLLGVDVASAKSLNVDLLAPGGLPGRLTLMSEAALTEVGRWSS